MMFGIRKTQLAKPEILKPAQPLFIHRTSTLATATGDDGTIWDLTAKLKHNSPRTKFGLRNDARYTTLSFDYAIKCRQTGMTISIADPLQLSLQYQELLKYGRTQLFDSPILLPNRKLNLYETQQLVDLAGKDTLLLSLSQQAQITLHRAMARHALRYLTAVTKAKHLPKGQSDPFTRSSISWLKLRLEILYTTDQQTALLALQLITAPSPEALIQRPTAPVAKDIIHVASLALS